MGSPAPGPHGAPDQAGTSAPEQHGHMWARSKREPQGLSLSGRSPCQSPGVRGLLAPGRAAVCPTRVPQCGGGRRHGSNHVDEEADSAKSDRGSDPKQNRHRNEPTPAAAPRPVSQVRQQDHLRCPSGLHPHPRPTAPQTPATSEGSGGRAGRWPGNLRGSRLGRPRLSTCLSGQGSPAGHSGGSGETHLGRSRNGEWGSPSPRSESQERCPAPVPAAVASSPHLPHSLDLQRPTPAQEDTPGC